MRRTEYRFSRIIQNLRPILGEIFSFIPISRLILRAVGAVAAVRRAVAARAALGLLLGELEEVLLGVCAHLRHCSRPNEPARKDLSANSPFKIWWKRSSLRGD